MLSRRCGFSFCEVAVFIARCAKEVFASFLNSESITDKMSAARVVAHLNDTVCCGLLFVIYQNKDLIQRPGRGADYCMWLQNHALLKSSGKNMIICQIDLDGEKAMMAMDITSLTFEYESFDAIVCNHDLEHITDDKKAVKELFRVLKPMAFS